MVSDVTITSALSEQQQTQAAKTGLAEDFGDFLRLLTVQLQNQDPLSPMDTTEFTNQLVAFTGVEQQINTNQKLDDLVALNIGTAYSESQNYVGQEISYVSSEFDYTGKPSKLRYSLAGDAVLAKVNIVDEKGDTIFTSDVSTNAGVRDFVWNGTTNNGGKAIPGTYQIRVDALDINQDPVEATTVVTGVVRGTELQNGQIFLLVGDRAVGLANVLNTNTVDSSSSGTDALTSALGYVGLNITYLNTEATFNGSDPEEVEYTLDEDADQAKILILNEFGQTIFTDDVDTSKGAHSYVWDGRLNDNSIAEPGSYQFIIDALDENGTRIRTSSIANGVATGVETQGGKIFLTLGSRTIALDTVISADIVEEII